MILQRFDLKITWSDVTVCRTAAAERADCDRKHEVVWKQVFRAVRLGDYDRRASAQSRQDQGRDRRPERSQCKYKR